MNEIAEFRARREKPPVEMRPIAYAVMGYAEGEGGGFLCGHTIRHVPKTVSDEDAFRDTVDNIFAGVKRLRFAIVMGPGCMATVK